MTTIAFIVAAYLIGSLSFAVIVSRVMGLADPRTFGSGNPGATNVLRTGKKAAAALTLLGDGVKGWMAVVLAQWLGPRFGLAEPEVVMPSPPASVLSFSSQRSRCFLCLSGRSLSRSMRALSSSSSAACR